MLVMVPIVLFVNESTKDDWPEATLFALSVVVGLTPEMLPMIVTTCLAKGATATRRNPSGLTGWLYSRNRPSLSPINRYSFFERLI